MITTGAFLCRRLCRHFWQGKLTRRPTSPDERTDLVSLQFMCIFSQKKKCSFENRINYFPYWLNSRWTEARLWCCISAPRCEDRICGVVSGASPWELAHRKLFPITRTPQVKKGLKVSGKRLEIELTGAGGGWGGALTGFSDATVRQQLSDLFCSLFGIH